MTTEEDLRSLMHRDNKIWRERAAGLDACDEDEPIPHEMRAVARRKRVHHQRREEAS